MKETRVGVVRLILTQLAKNWWVVILLSKQVDVLCSELFKITIDYTNWLYHEGAGWVYLWSKEPTGQGF